MFEERNKGSIEVGKLADFVVLTKDPTAIDPEKIDEIKIAETIKEGETVYAATKEELAASDFRYPSSSGVNAFANLLRAAATEREFGKLPESSQTPMVRRIMANKPHDPSCLGPVMAMLTEAIVTGEGTGREK
jgi:hypothetical protein